MICIGTILGSTRPSRNGDQVARWVHAIASDREDATFELIDLREVGLPHLDESIPPTEHEYRHEHTRRWAAMIKPLDGFVIVTPEYNRSIPGALKDALDFIYSEWNNKAVGFVSYGSSGGYRAVEHLRGIASELQLADVRAQVSLMLATEFEDSEDFHPHEENVTLLNTVLDQVTACPNRQNDRGGMLAR